MLQQVGGVFPTDPSLERSFRGHRGTVSAVAFSPVMKQLVSSSQDGSIFVWHFKFQQRPFRFVGHQGPVTDICVTSSGTTIASASVDKTVRLWHNSLRADSSVIKAHSMSVRSVDLSLDDTLLLTGSDDKTVKLWSTADRKFMGSLTGHTNWVRSARFSPDARLAVSGGDDKTVRVWDLNRRVCVWSMSEPEGTVESVSFHPDGTCVAAAGNDCAIKIWDLRSRRLLQHYSAHKGPVSRVSVHPSGHYLLSSSLDSSLKVWDLREGRLLYTLYGHEGGVSACAFSPTGTHFASGGEDRLAMVWAANFVGQDEGDFSAATVLPASRKVTTPNAHRSVARGRSVSPTRPTTAPPWAARASAASPLLAPARQSGISPAFHSPQRFRSPVPLAERPAPRLSAQQGEPSVRGGVASAPGPAPVVVGAQPARGSVPDLEAAIETSGVTAVGGAEERGPSEALGGAVGRTRIVGPPSVGPLGGGGLAGTLVSQMSPGGVVASSQQQQARVPLGTRMVPGGVGGGGGGASAVIPDQVSSTLRTVSDQLSLFTQTLQLLEERMSANEGLLLDLQKKVSTPAYADPLPFVPRQPESPLQPPSVPFVSTAPVVPTAFLLSNQTRPLQRVLPEPPILQGAVSSVATDGGTAPPTEILVVPPQTQTRTSVDMPIDYETMEVPSAAADAPEYQPSVGEERDKEKDRISAIPPSTMTVYASNSPKSMPTTPVPPLPSSASPRAPGPGSQAGSVRVPVAAPPPLRPQPPGLKVENQQRPPA
eukprot:Cvel_10049.t1-p1 / transcript=Cvel_10049.t1 / gene=Cvel_10049 / organism=Chromera_velia_CCMP2878 / gene_product=POC1 centriolar protein homolog A, putative / transcript_product=POC1 centriolar protein homolog A, putative / location=Cvel_scaffold598:1-6837(-) / protein_length=764 / sequence_SO=supercontig / SO=protein_coding / is_pseudo=false